MILKSFLNKKTTKIYIIITVLFSLIISLSFNYRNYYDNIINKYFEGSFYYVNEESYKAIISKISKEIELDGLLKVVAVDSSSSEVLFYIDDGLNDNEVGISKYFIDDDKDYSDIALKKINKTYDKKYNYDIIYQIHAINSNTLKELGLNYNDGYVFKLKKWSERNDFDNYCEEKFDIRFTLYSTTQSNKASNFISLVDVLTVIPLVLGIIYIIIFFIMTVNILYDDNKKNIIYSEVGYSKKQIIKNDILKIIIMLFIMMLSMFIFYFFINLFI